MTDVLVLAVRVLGAAALAFLLAAVYAAWSDA
jgi:hypothetical protein